MRTTCIPAVAREADEGAAAHIWQLLMAGQLPLVAFYAVRWLPQASARTLKVLAVPAGAGYAPMKGRGSVHTSELQLNRQLARAQFIRLSLLCPRTSGASPVAPYKETGDGKCN